MLHVAARGYAAVVVQGGGAGGLTTSGEITVVLSEGTVHAGTVHSAAGEPVVGARVRAGALVAGSWDLAGIYHAVSTATRTVRASWWIRPGSPTRSRVATIAARASGRRGELDPWSR